MKILVLGSRIPWPLRDGGAIATYEMLLELAAQGTEITYFTYNTKKHYADPEIIEDKFNFCRIIPFYLDAGTKIPEAIYYWITGRNYNIVRFENEVANAELEKLLKAEKFDLVHIEGLYAMPFLHTVKSCYSGPVAYRAHNVEYKIWQTLASKSSGIKKWYLNSLAKGLFEYEKEMCPKVDAILPITQTDEFLIKQLAGDVKYHYYPAGLHVQNELQNDHAGIQTLGHIGSMEWMPNIAAMEWFFKNVWPMVLIKYPEAQFYLGGKSLSVKDPRFQFPGVINCGEVVNIAEFHSKYRIAIVPVFSGSGLRMKTVEAMGMGKPVISSAIGAEGIPYTAGVDIEIANATEEWLKAISDLFENQEKCRDIGNNGRKLVLEKFSIEKNTDALLQFYRSEFHLK